MRADVDRGAVVYSLHLCGAMVCLPRVQERRRNIESGFKPDVPDVDGPGHGWVLVIMADHKVV